MPYRIAGTYLGVCNCSLICPCPVDGKPTSQDGQCLGVIGFAVKEGNLDDTDLSGVNFALYNHFPSNLTSGNWKVGIVVDDSASGEQAQAVERIISGQEGGPFGEFVPLIGEYVGMERAAVSVSDTSASVAGKTDVTFEALTGPDGSPTKVHNAMFGFAPDYTIGKSAGTSNAFGLTFTPQYGESAQFEFYTGETGVHPRA